MDNELQDASLESIKAQFSGDIITPADPAYATRPVTMQRKDAPRAILRPKDSNDVAIAVAYAAQQAVPLSVRSGGHSMAGFSTNDGGIVIDLVHLNTVHVIDSSNHVVRIGSGAVWGDVAPMLAEQQLALSAGDTKSVGVGGLTLGGGIGWMVRKWGLAIDSLVGAEIVTAAGEVLYADQHNHADLFWAIRGGGGNFGVVTYFDFMAHPSDSMLYTGRLQFAPTSVKNVLQGWRDYMRNAPNEVTSIVRLMPPLGPAPAKLTIEVCYCGPADEAARYIEPLQKIDGFISSDAQKRPYLDFLEDARPAMPFKIFTRSTFLEKFSDKAIDIIAAASCKPGSLVLQLRSLGGAMADVPADATAFAFRTDEVMVAGGIPIPTGDTTKATEAWSAIALFGHGSYSNFSSDSSEDITQVYPQSTLERLISIKQRYDPKNLFSQNSNLTPEQ